MTHPDDKRGSSPTTGARPTSFCLGLGMVLGGMEEAKASSEMFHRKLNGLMLEGSRGHFQYLKV